MDAVRIPARSPNCNPHEERWGKSVTEESLGRLMPLGRGSRQGDCSVGVLTTTPSIHTSLSRMSPSSLRDYLSSPQVALFEVNDSVGL